MVLQENSHLVHFNHGACGCGNCHSSGTGGQQVRTLLGFFANYRGLAKKLVQIAAELYTGSRRV